MIAADFGDGDVLLWLVEFFLFLIYFWLLIIVIGDLFRDHELSGWAKALWVIFIVLLPYLGVLVYLIARGGSMHERAVKEAKQDEAAFRDYVQQVAATSSPATELERLASLHDRGKITDEEFAQAKAKVMAGV